MRALSLTNQQLNELKLAGATVPVELRDDLLKLRVAHLELEGDEASAGAFPRALSFALDMLPAVVGG
jgi:hypothetical protein